MCSAADDPTQHDGPVITRPRRYVLSGSGLSAVRINPISRRYWAAIPEAERDAIEAAVPAGHIVYIAPGHRAKPGTMDVSLRVSEGRDWRVVKATRGYLTGALVRSVLT